MLQFSTIRNKLTAMIFGVSALALVLSGVFIVIAQMTAFRQKIAQDHFIQTQLVANNCLAAVSFRDAEDAKLVLRSLSARSSLAYASVMFEDGRVLAAYRREGFHDAPQPIPDEGGSRFINDWLLASEPIVLNGQTIGTAFLQSDLSELAAFQYQVILIVAVSLALVFCVAWLISFKIQEFVSGPIERLTAVMREVSDHEKYSVRTDVCTEDEIGLLANAFNDMLSELELRDEQLQEREQRTQAYLNVAGVMIIALDCSGMVTLINPRGCELLCAKESDIIGKDWFTSFVPERLRDSSRALFESFMQDAGVEKQSYEGKILLPSGQERLIAWNNQIVRDQAGKASYVLLSGSDVTDRREAEAREIALRDQLTRAERMKSIGVLAGGVAHDLNNMLGPLLMLPELIEEDLNATIQGNKAAHEGVLDSIQVMKSSAKRAASVVRDLLALSRRGHYERCPLDVNALSCFKPDAAYIRDLRNAHPDVEVSVSLSDQPLMISASGDHLGRIIDNLVRNAAEAIEGAGFVRLCTSRVHLDWVYEGYVAVPPGDYAVITIQDNGKGIAEDSLPHIFEPFYTKKKKTHRSGSGLGLAIVNGIVDDHEGYIDVASKSGEGTTFTLYFPSVAVKDGVVETSAEEGEIVGGQGRVLVVDDEPSQRFMAQNSLARLGYTVGVAEDGYEAVHLFTEAKRISGQSPYDLVVLDMRMGADFDGLETLKEIQTLFPKQKVLIVSGHTEDDRSMAAMALGAKWLSKPYSLNELARAVGAMI